MSNKDIANFYFKKEGGLYICQCGKSRKSMEGTGYSNLLSHIYKCHPEYKEEYSSFKGMKQPSIRNLLDTMM
jgi:hypothetical protein